MTDPITRALREGRPVEVRPDLAGRQTTRSIGHHTLQGGPIRAGTFLDAAEIRRLEASAVLLEPRTTPTTVEGDQ